jgi:hypothetical protein
MARIPLGDFGRVSVQPTPAVRSDPSAYGAGVGQALERAGSIGMQEAGQDIAANNAQIDRDARQQAAEDKQNEREVQAEAKAQARQAAAEAKAAAREAARVKALTASATVTNGLNDLHDEVAAGLADGTLDKTKAVEHFTTKATKLQASGLEGVDPDNRPLVEAQLLDNVGRARRSVAGLVTAREKQDIKAGGLAYFEEMQRFAVRGPKEADQAIANVRTFWTATGPMAGEAPDVAATRIQQFAERVRFNQATSLVNIDPGAALKALRDPKYLPELDPGARTNLIQTADVRVTQASNRAANAAEAAARRMDTQWKALSTVFEAGKMLDPATAEAARKQFRGTPYAAALESMMAQAPSATAFASQPLAVQSQSLMALQASMNRGGANPEQIQAYRQAEQLHNATLADVRKDPYMAAAERGVIVGVAPLSLDIQQLPAQLAARARDAQQVSQWVGQDVSLFRPDEAEKIGNVLAAMPPKDRAGALVALRSAMTPGQAQAFATQLDPKDKATALALAYSDRKTTLGRYTSELILRGQQAKADGTSTKGQKTPDATVGQWSAEFADALTDVFPNQQTADNVREAALLISHGIASEAGGQLTGKDRERALRLAVGGEIVEHNGRKIPLPAGITEDALDKRLRAITANDLQAPDGKVRAGGVQMPVADFLKSLPGMPLMPVRSGQYVPLVGGRPVVNSAGQPIVIGVQ